MTSPATLQVRNLYHAYRSDPVLRGVSFEAPAGKVTAILGRSGCGKTTLLRIIAGLTVPQSGTIQIAGHDASSTPTHMRNIGFVFQDLALFPHLSVRRNVDFAFRHGQAKRNGIDPTRATDEILRSMSILAVADRPVSTLSGGMKQRVAIARALVYRPAILLLDEPLSSLDNPRKQDLLKLLAEIRHSNEHTVLYVTHDDREVRQLADRLIVLEKGTVVADGQLSDVLREKNPVVSQLLIADYGKDGL